MKVVVVGGMGFLGSHVCEMFKAAGEQVVAVDNLTKFELLRTGYNVEDARDYNVKYLAEKKVLFLKDDVRNKDMMEQICNDADYPGADDLMAQVEGAQATILRLTTEAENIERAWRLEQQELSAQQEALSAALRELDERRRGLASKVDQSSLRLYEELRAKKQGRAVAKVEQGMCQGCRIVLPARDLQRARGSQGLVQCSSCERILYIS